MERKRISNDIHKPFTIELGDQEYDYWDCITIAQICNTAAGISEEIMQTPDGRYFRITVIADEGYHGTYCPMRGWYVAFPIAEKDVQLIRDSWGVLCRQPPVPPLVGSIV
jgi:hypothetical protein